MAGRTLGWRNQVGRVRCQLACRGYKRDTLPIRYRPDQACSACRGCSGTHQAAGQAPELAGRQTPWGR